MRRLAQALCALGLVSCLALAARATGVTNMLLGAGATPIYQGALTSVTWTVSPGPPVVAAVGFSASAGEGSLSPTAISGGTITDVSSEYVSGACSQSFLAITFAADPGQSWLKSVVVSGGSSLLGSAATYSYSGTTAQWSWGIGCLVTNAGSFTLQIDYL